MIGDKSATNSQLVEPRSRNLQLKIWCKLWPLKQGKKDKEIRLAVASPKEDGGL